jgi:hypothetical protein
MRTLTLGALALAAFLPPRVLAQTRTWQPTAAGTYSWTTDANWDGPFPNGPSAVANLTAPITGNQTVNLDAPITLSQLTLGNGSNSYTVAAGSGGDLTCGGITTSSITSSQLITAPVTAASGLTITQNGSLTLSGVLQYQSSLSLSGAGSRTFNGSIGGSGDFTVPPTFSGTVNLNAPNSLFGRTWSAPRKVVQVL